MWAMLLGASALTLGSLAGPVDAGHAGVPFQLGELERNLHKGTARLSVTVPAEGKVEIEGPKTVTHTKVLFAGPGEGSLPIRARQGEPVKRLRRTGRLKVKLEIFYVPQGPNQPPGGPSTLSKTVTLRLKR